MNEDLELEEPIEEEYDDGQEELDEEPQDEVEEEVEEQTEPDEVEEDSEEDVWTYKDEAGNDKTVTTNDVLEALNLRDKSEKQLKAYEYVFNELQGYSTDPLFKAVIQARHSGIPEEAAIQAYFKTLKMNVPLDVEQDTDSTEDETTKKINTLEKEILHLKKAKEDESKMRQIQYARENRIEQNKQVLNSALEKYGYTDADLKDKQKSQAIVDKFVEIFEPGQDLGSVNITPYKAELLIREALGSNKKQQVKSAKIAKQILSQTKIPKVIGGKAKSSDRNIEPSKEEKYNSMDANKKISELFNF